MIALAKHLTEGSFVSIGGYCTPIKHCKIQPTQAQGWVKGGWCEFPLFSVRTWHGVFRKVSTTRLQCLLRCRGCVNLRPYDGAQPGTLKFDHILLNDGTLEICLLERRQSWNANGHQCDAADFTTFFDEEVIQ